jgi:hypothetical protein
MISAMLPVTARIDVQGVPEPGHAREAGGEISLPSRSIGLAAPPLGPSTPFPAQDQSRVRAPSRSRSASDVQAKLDAIDATAVNDLDVRT